MSALWVVVLLAVLGCGSLLVLAARRTHDEISPTIEAFARFRAAISPRVATLRAETAVARRRMDRAAAEIEGRQG